MKPLTQTQQAMLELWKLHMRCEFETCSAEGTLATMVPDGSVTHVPVLTGGDGRDELRDFYATHFIPKMPPDTTIAPISITIGEDRLIEEIIFQFTHTIEMDFMLPGIPPTGKRVELPVVVIVEFRDGKIAGEHIYWDQASALVQIGLLDPKALPVVGVESARRIRDRTVPANELIKRAGKAR
jgi:carboxymethylenebutenolidase